MSHFYDGKYQSEEFFWGMKPSSLANRVAALFPPDAAKNLLDIGCGEGKDAIFFARSGFQVEGFDVSSVGIEKAQLWARELNLNIYLFQADVNSYRLQRVYTVLFSSGVLQYVPENSRADLVNHYKVFTEPGGLNAFTVPVYKPFLPSDPEQDENEIPWKSGELFTYYHDWKIEYCAEDIIEYEREGFPSKFAVNRLIAVRP